MARLPAYTGNSDDEWDESWQADGDGLAGMRPADAAGATPEQGPALPPWLTEVTRALSQPPAPAAPPQPEAQPEPETDPGIAGWEELRRQRRGQELQADLEAPFEPDVHGNWLIRDLEASGWFERQRALHSAERERVRAEAIRRSQESAARQGTTFLGRALAAMEIASAASSARGRRGLFTSPSQELTPGEAGAAGQAEVETAEAWAPRWRALADLIPEQYRTRPEIETRMTGILEALRRNDIETARRLGDELNRTQPWLYFPISRFHQMLESQANTAAQRLDRARRMARGEADLPRITETRQLFETGARTLAQSFTSSLIESLGIVQGHIQEGFGLGAADDTTLYRFGQLTERLITQAFPGDPARQFEFSTQLAQGVASTTAFLGAGLAGRLARLGPGGQLALIGLSGAAMQTPEEFERVTQAIREGRATADDRLWVSITNALAGTTEALPFIPTFARRGVRGVGGVLARGGEQAVEEALQEAFQTRVQNEARRFYDPSQDPNENVLQGALIGLIVGGLFGAAMSQPQANAEARAAIARARTLGLGARGPTGRQGEQPPAGRPPPAEVTPPAAAPAFDAEAAAAREAARAEAVRARSGPCFGWGF